MSNARIDDIEGKLFYFCKIANDNHSAKILLGVLFEKIKQEQIEIEQAIRCSTRLLVQTGLYFEKEYYNLYGIDDSFDLAKDRILGDLTGVADSYVNEISVYSIFFDEFQRMYLAEMKNEWDS